MPVRGLGSGSCHYLTREQAYSGNEIVLKQTYVSPALRCAGRRKGRNGSIKLIVKGDINSHKFYSLKPTDIYIRKAGTTVSIRAHGGLHYIPSYFKYARSTSIVTRARSCWDMFGCFN
jgi:hypothetical protein